MTRNVFKIKKEDGENNRPVINTENGIFVRDKGFVTEEILEKCRYN